MDEPIRVAHIMGKMINGGVEAVIMNYYRHIDKSKVQFDFIVDEDSTVVPKDEIENMGGRVYVVPPYQCIREYLRTLKKLFRDNKYKIVHSNINTLSVFPLYAAKKAGVPIRIAHNHSTAGKGETKRNIMKYMLRPFAKLYPTHYAACSNYAGEWLFGKRSMEKGDVTVFNNAIDLDRYKHNEEIRKQVRTELGFKDEFVIGHIGRFCYQKNHEFLIKIFNEVHKLNQNSALLLIGTGDLVDDVKQLIADYGLAEHVKMLGNRFDCDRLYQAMDAFVLTSRYEGLPVVGVEAQASGIPCVFSTAMTKETKMLDSTIMLDLDKSAEEWAKVILSVKKEAPETVTEGIRAHGFDIDMESKKMEKFYAQMNI